MSNTQNSLIWTASTDSGGTITAYIIQRCQGSGCSSFAQIASINPSTSYVDSGLTPATSYSYRVEAEDSNSLFSSWSNTASATTLASSVSGGITYGYDALGRLVQATVAGDSTVENYTYDKSGNLTSAVSNPSSRLGIANLSNTQGSAGGQITIYGSGFSTTPANNTVSFNGLATTVVSATGTQLVVKVPTGATSGSITVKTGSTTVTSPSTFSVTAATTAPMLARFFPTVALSGTAITITGTGFQPTLANNRVQINESWATVIAATTTSLTVAVPLDASSGPVTVVTPNGSVTSASSLIIPPGGATLASIGSLGVIAVNGSAVNVSVPNGSQTPLTLFTGSEGADLALGVSANTLTSGTISVYSPNGTSLLSGVTIPANGQAIQLPTLPATGTYTIQISPAGYTGGLTLNLVGTLTGTLTLNGSATSMTLADSGQAATLTFAGTASAYVTLNISNVSIPAGTVTITNPDGSALMTASLGAAGALLLPQLPMTGTYTVTLLPTGNVGGGFTAALTSTAAATLTANQGVYNLTLTNQNPVSLTFRAVAGSYVSLAGTESNGLINTGNAIIQNPDGSQLTSSLWNFCQGTCGYGSNVTNIGPLAESGTYTAVIQATNSTGSGTIGLTLATPVTGVLPMGATTNINVSLNGQGIEQTFSGMAGNFVSVASEGFSSNFTGTLTLINPDGTVATTTPMTGISGGVLALGPLQATGTYTVVQQQTTYPATGTIPMTLAQPVNGGALSVGSSNNATVSFPGGGIEDTFAATQGQYLSLALQLQNGSGGLAAGTVTILDPSGNVYQEAPFTGICGTGCSGGAVLDLSPAPLSGTYTVILQQEPAPYGATGTVTTSLASPVTGSLPMGASNISVPLPGQGIEYSFSGSAGQYLSLALQTGSGGSGDSGTLLVFGPGGALISSAPYSNYCSAQCNSLGVVNLGPLPTTGTYTALFQQGDDLYPQSGTFVANLSAPLSGTLTVGTPNNVSITVPGQGIEQTFSATAGQYYAVTLTESGSGTYIPNATLTVLNSSGATVSSASLNAYCSPSCSASAVANLGPVPSTGTYTALVQTAPTAQDQGTGTLTLGITSTTAAAGKKWTLSTSTQGNSATFTFSGAAGQALSLALTSATLKPSTVTSYTVSVSQPDGSGLAGVSCYTSSAGCELGLPTLTESGTYTVTVAPGGQATLSMTATLSTDVTGVLVSGTPSNVNLSTVGQSATFTFVIGANRDFSLIIDNITTAPAGQLYNAQLLDPNGYLLENGGTGPVSSQNATPGTYIVIVTPVTPVTGTMQISLTDSPPAPMTFGTAANLSTNNPGQWAYSTFYGTAGELVSLALTNVNVSPAQNNYYDVLFYGPDGTAIEVNQFCLTSNSYCEVNPALLTKTGTWTIVYAWPQNATASFSATLSQVVVASLSVGVPYTLNLPTLGQSAALTFPVTGDAGSTVAVNVANVTTNPSGGLYSFQMYSLYAAGGGQIIANSYVSSGNVSTTNFQNLVPGTYSLLIDPTVPQTGSMQITVEPGITPLIPLSGTGIAVAAPAPGQFAYMTFDGTAGQSVSLALSNMVSNPDNTITVAVTDPTGASVTGAYCYTSNPGCELTLMNLSLTGVYTVEAYPDSNSTMSFTATMSSDFTASMSSGVPVNLNLSSLGQSALLSFTATTGQSPTISLNNISTVPASTYENVTVYDPTGTQIANNSIQTSGTVSLSGLAAGKYSVLITPQNPATSTMQVSYH